MAGKSLVSKFEEVGLEIERRLSAAEDLLTNSFKILGDEHEDELSTVQEWIEECRRQLSSPVPVSIALLGGTGAGKSTLVNALIGATVLPTSAFAVCTSAITRVRYRKSDKFSAKIDFVPRETWELQLLRAADDIRAAKDVDPEEASYVNEITIPEDEAKRIQAVYGEDAFSAFKQSGEVSDLLEPESITAAFLSGSEFIECDSTEELRKQVARFLTSGDIYWPVVRSCEIEGPFEGFDHGGELVDLPGLNDPNEAREELTRTFLESARFVWVVFNMKRALGKDLTEVLKSRDLLNRLMAGGRLSTLTFIGTHSDDVTSIDPIDYGLDEDTELSEIALKRNELAEGELRSNLRQIANSINSTPSSGSASDAIIDTLLVSPAFMVSASNYLQNIGAKRSKNMLVFSDRFETNIPQLSNHINQLCMEAGPKAQAFGIATTIEEIVATIGEAAQSANAKLVLSETGSATARAALAAEAQSIADSLSDSTNGTLSRLRRSLQEAVRLFKEGSAIDKEAVAKVVLRTTSTWSSTHWATMRATTSRGGRFTSPTKGEIDLIKDLNAPVIKHSMGPWTDFFERDLPALTQEATTALREAVNVYSSQLGELGKDDEELTELLKDVLSDLGADVNEAVDAALAVAQKAIETETQKRQQELHRITEEAIISGMKPVFARAAAERGTGMKQRMNQHLESGSASAVRKACDLVQARLADTSLVAMEAVLNGVDPVAKRIIEKSQRTARLLSEHKPATSGPSQDEVTQLLGKVSKARGLVNAPILFARSIPTVPTVRPATVTDHSENRQSDIPVVLIDASNVARNGGQAPDIVRLKACLDAARLKFNGHQVSMIADASLSRITERESTQSDLTLLKALIAENDLVMVPPGSPGKADKYILDIASNKVAIVISNDSFKEFQGDHQWLFDEGRLFGHGEVPGVGWNFTVRFPVRPRTY
jgi:predicted GTPase